MSNSNDVVDNDNEINWSKVIKKEAIGYNDADFGEVQEIVLHYVLTERGILNRDKFYLPTALADGSRNYDKCDIAVLSSGKQKT